MDSWMKQYQSWERRGFGFEGFLERTHHTEAELGILAVLGDTVEQNCTRSLRVQSNELDCLSGRYFGSLLLGAQRP